MLDNCGLNHGLWETKDSAAYLEKEIKHKFAIGYRTRYAENLKRELPRIPFIGVAAEVTRRTPSKSPSGPPPHVGGYGASFFPLSAVEKRQGDTTPDHNPKASAKLFHEFADAGQKLADRHVNYESAQEYPLKRQENKAVKLDWRVEAMKLSKVGTRSTASQASPNRKIGDDVEVVPTASIIYNDFLTLSGLPPEVFDYKLGNRSALEWVIDQYRVTCDEKGNLASDPNRLDDEQYIVRLLGQVITVSLETVKNVKELPGVVLTRILHQSDDSSFAGQKLPIWFPVKG